MIENDKRLPSYIEAESLFCKCCEKECQSKRAGCKEWREYFVKNWNENISTYDPGQQQEKIFRYEHPDLIREGIVFMGGDGE
jgi:hypothetical protein